MRLNGPRTQGLATATSVFFGGGTPSRLSAEELLRILDAIPRSEDAEVTVECNPEDASLERLGAYRAGGVKRMSFGVQSTQPAVLADLGRRHGTMAHREVSEAVTAAGFSTWNMDLIVGSRAENLDDVRHTLSDLLDLENPPPHISCYALTPEPATPLGRDPARHPDEDATADAYDLVGEVLDEQGYLWEEISNWAKPGHECRHNHVYWEHGDYAVLARPRTRTNTDAASGTCARPIATSNSSRRASRHSGAKSSSMSRAKRLNVTHSPCAPHMGCRSKRSTHSTRSLISSVCGRSRDAHAEGSTRREPGDRPT